MTLLATVRHNMRVYGPMYGYTAKYTAIRRNVRHILLYDLHTAYEPYMYLAIYDFGGPYSCTMQ